MVEILSTVKIIFLKTIIAKPNAKFNTGITNQSFLNNSLKNSISKTANKPAPSCNIAQNIKTNNQHSANIIKFRHYNSKSEL